MDESNAKDVSTFVNRHVAALISEGQTAGLDLDDLTIELAAHAMCAALSFWSEEDLHGLLQEASKQLKVTQTYSAEA